LLQRYFDDFLKGVFPIVSDCVLLAHLETLINLVQHNRPLIFTILDVIQAHKLVWLPFVANQFCSVGLQFFNA